MRGRLLRVAAGAAALAAGTIFTVSFITVLVVATQDDRRPVDAIVVLGAAQYNGRPSPVLRARLDHGYDLYREGYAKRLIVTGGVGRGDRVSEAEVGRRYLRSRGVPPDAIALEPNGRSTEESMTAVAGWLAPQGLSTVLLVSDPFHLARLKLEAKRVKLAAFVSPTGTSPISDRPRLELRFLLAEAFKLPVAWLRSL